MVWGAKGGPFGPAALSSEGGWAPFSDAHRFADAQEALGRVSVACRLYIGPTILVSRRTVGTASKPSWHRQLARLEPLPGDWELGAVLAHVAPPSIYLP